GDRMLRGRPSHPSEEKTNDSTGVLTMRECIAWIRLRGVYCEVAPFLFRRESGAGDLALLREREGGDQWGVAERRPVAKEMAAAPFASLEEEERLEVSQQFQIVAGLVCLRQKHGRASVRCEEAAVRRAVRRLAHQLFQLRGRLRVAVLDRL